MCTERRGHAETSIAAPLQFSTEIRREFTRKTARTDRKTDEEHARRNNRVT
jgi:hypothetical protein